MTEFTNPNDYQKEADRTKCDQIDALDRLNECPHFVQVARMSLLHGIIGLIGELGELAGIVERWLWYGQDFDHKNFVEELGDSQWYSAELHNAVEVSMLEVMRANIRKLKSRYPEKFDKELAKEENRNREGEMNAAIKESKTGPITSRVIKTPNGWEDYFDTKVIDPDGWRNDGDPNWGDPICKEEFAARWYLSTCKQPPKGELKEMVDILAKRGFRSIEDAVATLQEPKPGDYIIPDKNIVGTEGEVSLRVQQTFSGIREVREQTGQGFAEPLEERIEELTLPDPGSDPRYKTMKPLVSRELVSERVNNHQVATDQIREPPEGGWAVARKIATIFVEGQNLAYALKSIDAFEKQRKEYEAGLIKDYVNSPFGDLPL